MTQSTGDFDRAEAHLAEILALPQSEQAAALEELCASEPELEELLRRGYAALESSALIDELDAPGEALPEIEGVQILRRLGVGGMGTVYLAEQLEPVRREVAVKVVSQGMATSALLARFAQERQALARMSHPGVAQVFGAGTTATGAPYFVMEYVEGRSIHRYCREKSLTIGERLALFLQVCEGVQHAHQKGVIHRDLKPSNILVRDSESGPLAKIIDFGIAKAVADKIGDETLLTEQGALVGTPEYMSPEQAALDPSAIDTRTDVYALGVLLYQLLCDELPFPSFELRKMSIDEIARTIRETMPPRPSQRWTTTVSRGETSMPETGPSWARRLRGDLDWITMKAIEKEPERRYASPLELAADVRRHLAHEPVLAGPPSSSYRLRRFVRRNRVSVGAALAVLLALGIGLIVSLVQFREAVTQRRLAESRLDGAKEGFASMSRITRSIVFDLDRKIRDLPGSLEARKYLLERSLLFLEELERTAAREGMAETMGRDLRWSLAEATHKVGEILGLDDTHALGDPKEALRLTRRALELWEEIYRAEGEEQDPTLLVYLADALEQIAELEGVERGWKHVEPTLERAADLLRPAAVSGSVAAANKLAELEITRASGLRHQGRYREALKLLEPVLADLRKRAEAAPEDRELQLLLGAMLTETGFSASYAGEAKLAMSLVREGVAANRTLVSAFPENPRYRVTLAVKLRQLALREAGSGDPGAAIATMQEALELFGRACEENPANVVALSELVRGHMYTCSLAANLGKSELSLQSYEKSMRALEAAKRRGLLSSRRERFSLLCTWKEALFALLHHDMETERDLLADFPGMIAEFVELGRGTPSAELQMQTSEARRYYGTVLVQRGRLAEARAPLSEAIAGFRSLRKEGKPTPYVDWSLGFALIRLAGVMEAAEEHGTALELYQEALAIRRALSEAQPDSFPNREMHMQAAQELIKFHVRHGDDEGRKAAVLLKSRILHRSATRENARPSEILHFAIMGLIAAGFDGEKHARSVAQVLEAAENRFGLEVFTVVGAGQPRVQFQARRLEYLSRAYEQLGEHAAAIQAAERALEFEDTRNSEERRKEMEQRVQRLRREG